MKRIIIGLCIAALLYSCVPKEDHTYVDTDIYGLSTIRVVPDSLRAKQAAWITETMKASTSSLTTSDYEDPEDVVEEVYNKSVELFGVQTRALRIYNAGTWEYLPEPSLTPEYREIFNRLIKREQSSSLQ